MKGLRLFRVLGIQISLNYTWFIVFGLIAWSKIFTSPINRSPIL